MKNLLGLKSVENNENGIAQFKMMALSKAKTQAIKGGNANNGGISEIIISQ